MDEELSLQAAPDPLRSERANMARRLSCRGRARNRSCAPLPRGKRARNGVRGSKIKPAVSDRPESDHHGPSTLLRRALPPPPRCAKLGRESCRERVCKSVEISVVAGSLKKTTNI